MNGWEPAPFFIAVADGPEMRHGFTRSGLGLDQRGADEWSVTHLGTGHRICHVFAEWPLVTIIAAEIAELTDWSFGTLGGYANSDPDLPAKFHALMRRWPEQMHKAAANDGDARVARMVAEAQS